MAMKGGLLEHTLSKLKPAIKSYMERSKLEQEEIDKAREQKDVEKRRVQEKQIRALRNTYRPAGGFLQQNAGNDNLGATSESLPSKLGA